MKNSLLKVMSIVAILMAISLPNQMSANEFDVYEQQEVIDSLSSPVLSEAERIVDKYGGKIADAFSEGLSKVAPVAEDGFRIMVIYHRAEGITVVLGFLISLFFAYKCASGIKEVLDERDTEGRQVALIAGAIVFSIATCVFLVNTFSWGLTSIIAPEYYAIKEIISMF